MRIGSRSLIWPPAAIICIRTWRGTRSHIISQVGWNWHRNRGDRSAEREKNKREKQEDEMVQERNFGAVSLLGMIP